MNIEEAIKYIKNDIEIDKDTASWFENGNMTKKQIEESIDAYETLLTAYEKEKEKNKRAEELYMQHNQMIIDILKECNYMIKNRYYMNDTAIRQHAEDIKNIAKYYIKQPEWEEE